MNIIKKICTSLPDSKLAILSNSELAIDILDAFQAGAKGYINRDISVNELLQEINNIKKGNIIVTSPMASKLLVEINLLNLDGLRSSASVKHGLTKREEEILVLLSRGVSNKEIAESLFISENTVRVHVHRIMKKFKVFNRFQAAIFAIKENIIDNFP